MLLETILYIDSICIKLWYIYIYIDNLSVVTRMCDIISEQKKSPKYFEYDTFKHCPEL